MINRTVLVGRLTKDPELRYTSSNIAFCKFTIAVNRPYPESNGEREADFIQCVAWRKPAENMSRFVRKGSLIGAEGRIQTGSYDDKDGKRVYTTDVVCDSVQFLEPKSQGNQRDSEQYRNPGQHQSTPSIDVTEDDLPF
jgi:single-strand DNA-binding protein